MRLFRSGIVLIPVLCVFACTEQLDQADGSGDTGVAPEVVDARVLPFWNINQAYLGAWSVQEGESIDVYVSSGEPYSLELKRMGIWSTFVWGGGPYTGSMQSLPESTPWKTSLNWLNPVAVPIPADSDSGVYQLAVRYSDGDVSILQFVVRDSEPGSTSRILVLDNATTRAAYNNWGGKSVYSFNSTGSEPAIEVSMYRPGQNRFADQQIKFLRWAEAADIDIEWASTLDWHNDPDIFDPYDTIVLVEHSEYWTLEMRNKVDAFVAAGGSLVSFSGNTAWWQIRLEGDLMAAYKWAPGDPLYGVDDARVTTNFFAAPVNNPENSTIGVSFRNGGYHNNDGHYMEEDGWGGFDVVNPRHPLFAGTALQYGDQFGVEATIAGYEVDGAEYSIVGGIPVVTGSDGTPHTLEILATTPAATSSREAMGTIVAGEVGDNGGQIINMSTVDWADGLWAGYGAYGHVADPVVGKITLNVFKQASPGSGAECSPECHSEYNDADRDGLDDKCDLCILLGGPNRDYDGDGTGEICEPESSDWGVPGG